MKITKFGHCCILVEEGGVQLLIDPGSFTRERHEHIKNIDAVLFTHEHQDHFHIESLKIVLSNNPTAKVLCNESVASLLSSASIAHEVVKNGDEVKVKGVSIAGYGSQHAAVHSSTPTNQNTGFYIANHFWYPGDALTEFPQNPAVLALPIAGPWMKLSEALDYAIKLKPTGCFPVHDMVLSDAGAQIHRRIAKNILEPQGIQFYETELDKEYEF